MLELFVSTIARFMGIRHCVNLIRIQWHPLIIEFSAIIVNFRKTVCGKGNKLHPLVVDCILYSLIRSHHYWKSYCISGHAVANDCFCVHYNYYHCYDIKM